MSRLRKVSSASAVNDLADSKSEKIERTSDSKRRNQGEKQSLTLWGYLMHELYDANGMVFFQDKVEHLVDVVKVPVYLERVIAFGMLMCLDTFLYTFTILPLRGLLAVWRLRFVGGSSSRSTVRKGDAVKCAVFLAVLYALIQLDTSRIYHNIRGQAAIKLYVMFNVLEIADKLFCAIGQDILEGLLSLTTLTSNGRLVLFSIVTTGYCYVHSVVLLFQVITLNVAVNSYSNALLTLLLSNQFSEIKSAVFKKFDRENLFQLTCADITERFQLLIMLLVIGVRNMVEVNETGLVPTFWAGWNRWIGALFGPAIVVVGSELIVDWLKHAYIAKFNNIRPRIYRKYLDVLAIDYASHAFADQILTKRMGLPVYPLVAVVSKMLLQSYKIMVEVKSAALAHSQTSSYEEFVEESVQSDRFRYFLNRTWNWILSIRNANSTSTNISLAASSSAPSSPQTLHKDSDFSRQLYFHVTSALIVCILFVVLLSFKLVLGMTLLKYTSSRRSQVANRRARAQSCKLNDFLPAPTKGFGTIELDEPTRESLYEPNEQKPRTKSRSLATDGVDELLEVTRFKMAAKRIW